MATPTSASIIEASRDSDLLSRAVSLGSTLGMSQSDVEKNRIRFAHASVNENGDTIASVYEFTVSERPKYRPGEDPTGVTDEQILEALTHIKEDSDGVDA